MLGALHIPSQEVYRFTNWVDTGQWQQWSSICKLVYSYTRPATRKCARRCRDTEYYRNSMYLQTDTCNQVQRDFPACTKLAAVQVCLKLFKISWKSGPQNQRHTAKALQHYHKAMNLDRATEQHAWMCLNSLEIHVDFKFSKPVRRWSHWFHSLPHT